MDRVKVKVRFRVRVIYVDMSMRRYINVSICQ
jgi:hypothetical protein